jgi:hypothetical protein
VRKPAGRKSREKEFILMKPYQTTLLFIILSIFIIGCSSIRQNLLAYYSFNGTASDASGNGNNGINHGAVYTEDRFGKANSACLFNKDAIIFIPELFSDSCSEFTFAAWIKKYTTDNGSHVVVYKGSNQGETAISITEGKIGFGVNLHVPGAISNQNWYSGTIPDTLETNVDYFLVGRYIKGKKVEFFINGELVASESVPDLKLWSDPSGCYSAIGTHGAPTHSPTYFWNGVIDDIRIYSRALSDDDIQNLYHEGGWMTK